MKSRLWVVDRLLDLIERPGEVGQQLGTSRLPAQPTGLAGKGGGGDVTRGTKRHPEDHVGISGSAQNWPLSRNVSCLKGAMPSSRRLTRSR